MDILRLIGRVEELFTKDIQSLESELARVVSENGFLVIGGAGSIGQAVTIEIFKRNPRVLHVVDISENNLVELVRDIRSSHGYGSGSFETFALDCGSPEFEAMLNSQHERYDYVLNLSALKHVRSESNPFTLMRLINTNIFNGLKVMRQLKTLGTFKHFAVSTDKAANPVNMMGASKRIMELFMMQESRGLATSLARFANVAFSDGSLLHGFNQRILKAQPISAPNDVRRYFLTPKESGELCLLAAVYGHNLDVFFPKLSETLHLTTFSDISREYLRQRGYQPFECDSEQEARSRVDELRKKGFWPCYFFESDTAGEKDVEEFHTDEESVDYERFRTIGVIRNSASFDSTALENFERACGDLRERGTWTKRDLVTLFQDILPNFDHLETGKYLDQRM